MGIQSVEFSRKLLGFLTVWHFSFLFTEGECSTLMWTGPSFLHPVPRQFFCFFQLFSLPCFVLFTCWLLFYAHRFSLSAFYLPFYGEREREVVERWNRTAELFVWHCLFMCRNWLVSKRWIRKGGKGKRVWKMFKKKKKKMSRKFGAWFGEEAWKRGTGTKLFKATFNDALMSSTTLSSTKWVPHECIHSLPPALKLKIMSPAGTHLEPKAIKEYPWLH